MSKPISLDTLLDRYKKNKKSICVQVKPMTSNHKKIFIEKAEKPKPVIVIQEQYKEGDRFYIQNEKQRYIGIINFLCEVDAMIFETEFRTQSIIHTYKELPYVENVLKSRRVCYKLIKIKNPEEIGASELETNSLK